MSKPSRSFMAGACGHDLFSPHAPIEFPTTNLYSQSKFALPRLSFFGSLESSCVFFKLGHKYSRSTSISGAENNWDTEEIFTAS
jgi:hypothetical protein